MNFFVKALLKQKLKGTIPDDQLDMFITMVEKNPAFFEQIAKEIQAKVSQGMSQQDAAMKVMEGHKAELGGMMGQTG
jgi:hypothetical protein